MGGETSCPAWSSHTALILPCSFAPWSHFGLRHPHVPSVRTPGMSCPSLSTDPGPVISTSHRDTVGTCHGVVAGGLWVAQHWSSHALPPSTSLGCKQAELERKTMGHNEGCSLQTHIHPGTQELCRVTTPQVTIAAMGAEYSTRPHRTQRVDFNVQRASASRSHPAAVEGAAPALRRRQNLLHGAGDAIGYLHLPASPLPLPSLAQPSS